MALITSLLIAALFGGGLYLLMRKNMFEVVLGTALISHGVNLFLLTAGGWSRDQRAAVIIDGVEASSAYANPLAQALILTAIVISFAVTAFLVVLVARNYEDTQDIESSESGSEDEDK